MASLLSSTQPLPPAFNRGQSPATKPATLRAQTKPHAQPTSNISADNNARLAVTQRKALELQRLKDKEAKDRKEETNKKIASRKAISVFLRREATESHIEKKKGSRRLLPRIVLEALHERITALRWESALKKLRESQDWEATVNYCQRTLIICTFSFDTSTFVSFEELCIGGAIIGRFPVSMMKQRHKIEREQNIGMKQRHKIEREQNIGEEVGWSKNVKVAKGIASK